MREASLTSTEARTVSPANFASSSVVPSAPGVTTVPFRDAMVGFATENSVDDVTSHVLPSLSRACTMTRFSSRAPRSTMRSGRSESPAIEQERQASLVALATHDAVKRAASSFQVDMDTSVNQVICQKKNYLPADSGLVAAPRCRTSRRESAPSTGIANEGAARFDPQRSPATDAVGNRLTIQGACEPHQQIGNTPRRVRRQLQIKLNLPIAPVNCDGRGRHTIRQSFKFGHELGRKFA